MICLAMIVKDESRIIRRCLSNMKRYINSWIVIDTGSTDDTVSEVQKTMEGIPGELHHREWKGFGDAKTASLCLARELAKGEGYAFVVDADEMVNGDLPKELTADSYHVWLQLNNIRYTNTRLFRLDKDWKYEGVLHEFPVSKNAKTQGVLDSVTITTPRDGARGKEINRYSLDAEVLETEIERMKSDPTSDYPLMTRYIFYLAQSYRDAGDNQKSLVNYLKRAEMGSGLNWEEVYVSYLNAGRCLSRMGMPHEAHKMLLKAHHQQPDRAEALRDLHTDLTRRLRISEAKQPVGTLFVEESR